MSIIVGAGNFGCYTAGHVINSLDESSYLSEQEAWRIKTRTLMPSIAAWYTERSRNTFVPNAIYLEHARAADSEEQVIESDYQLWRKGLDGAEPQEVPAFSLPKNIGGVREMLDDQRYVNLPRLRSNRPWAERQELVNESIRKGVEAMDHVQRLMLPLDSCTYHNGHLDLLSEEQLLPSPLDFVKDELTHTPCAVLAGCGLALDSLPTSEIYAQRLLLQGALCTYLDIHQDFSSRQHTLLIPAYQSALIGYENLSLRAVNQATTTAPTVTAAALRGSGRPSLDLNTVYEKAFTASLVIDSLSRVGDWGMLRPPFSPLVSAELKLAPAPLTPYIVNNWSLHVDMTQLHPLANALITSQTHQFNHVTHRGRLDAPDAERGEVISEPLPLSWSSNLKMVGKPAVAYECCLSAALNNGIPTPAPANPDAIAPPSSIDLLLDEFLPSILKRSDIVDRIERDHLSELVSVVADIRDDCQLQWRRD